MGAYYPWRTFPAFTTPNGNPLRAHHINRIAQEVNAVQSVLGRKVAGNASSVLGRLLNRWNDDGTIKKEVICEGDPEGGTRGTRRYFWYSYQGISCQESRWNGFGFTTVYASAGKFWLPANVFADAPPIVFVCREITSAGTPSVLGSFAVRKVTRTQVIVAGTDGGGQHGTGSSVQLRLLAVSRNLIVYEEDEHYINPQVPAHDVGGQYAKGTA